MVWLPIMASNPSLLAEEAPDLWYSGKVDNDQLPLVAYQVKALASAAKTENLCIPDKRTFFHSMKKRARIPYFMACGRCRKSKPEPGEDKGTCGDLGVDERQYFKLPEEVSYPVETFKSNIKRGQVESSRRLTWFRILNTLEKKKKE